MIKKAKRKRKRMANQIKKLTKISRKRIKVINRVALSIKVRKTKRATRKTKAKSRTITIG